MSEPTNITPPPAGKIEVKLGDQHVDIAELGNILSTAGESITTCFGTADSAEAYRRRAEAAEAKLAQLADLANFHGAIVHSRTGKEIAMNWEHFAKIMNGAHDA